MAPLAGFADWFVCVGSGLLHGCPAARACPWAAVVADQGCSWCWASGRRLACRVEDAEEDLNMTHEYYRVAPVRPVDLGLRVKRARRRADPAAGTSVGSLARTRVALAVSSRASDFARWERDEAAQVLHECVRRQQERFEDLARQTLVVLFAGPHREAADRDAIRAELHDGPASGRGGAGGTALRLAERVLASPLSRGALDLVGRAGGRRAPPAAVAEGVVVELVGLYWRLQEAGVLGRVSMGFMAYCLAYLYARAEGLRGAVDTWLLRPAPVLLACLPGEPYLRVCMSAWEPRLQRKPRAICQARQVLREALIALDLGPLGWPAGRQRR
jgi:hypothetical protein